MSDQAAGKDQALSTHELKSLIIDLIEEEFTPSPIPLAKRWAGGKLILQPDNDTQAKEVPLEVFFKKLTGIREALRVLEQKLNNHDAIALEDKANFQAYITKCYGSLTSFNLLFKEDKHKFIGLSERKKSASEDDGNPTQTVGQARKKLGLNEY